MAKITHRTRKKLPGQYDRVEVGSRVQRVRRIERTPVATFTPEQIPTHYGKYVLPRWPQNDEELYWFVQAVFGLRIPRTKVCPEHTTPFQAFADAFFARHPVVVWKASRGFGGKTRTLSALVNTEAVCLGSECSILGGSSAQSLNVHSSSKEMWAHHHAPIHLLADDPTKYDTNLMNGAHIRSLMASQASVRGPHPQRLRLDEIDEMDLNVLTAAQGQPMRKKNRKGEMVETQTVMSSTHQYPDKTMRYILDRAKEVGWPVYTWCYRETSNTVDGWLSPTEIARKRLEIPTTMWETEYDLQEPSFEGRAFDAQAVDDAFDAAFGNTNDDKWELGLQSYSRRQYITGVDWAKKHDWTEIITFDCTSVPWICIGVERLRRHPWPYMIDQAVKRFNKYSGWLAHDATGIGDVVSDAISEVLTKSQQNKFRDVIMGSGMERRNMFSDYISAVESGHVKFPMIQWLHEEHKYCSVDDLFGKGHPPDGIVACAIAWKFRGLANRNFVAPMSIERQSPWDMEEMHPKELHI